ncbi:hypothetical protein QQF64_013545 [Cirrhinus molitorella]|uniref:ST3 beta-galactoside alpha-2,3-sialyltransferase 1 n=1 Tax=Cirrhinus molitorella TaxID=172907 RepID=A0ABR3LRG9_9TELE
MLLLLVKTAADDHTANIGIVKEKTSILITLFWIVLDPDQFVYKDPPEKITEKENTCIDRTFVCHDLLYVCVQLHTQRTLAVLLQVHAGPVRKKNSMLSDETYRWWQWLQAERNPSNLTIVLDRLFQLIPDEELYVDAHPDRCRTCSVVGNSGNLRESRYGSYIDSSDFVIRMNQAPTQGFENDVGFKTTHHLMYPESATDLDNSTSLILIPFKTLDLEWIISSLTTGNISKTYVPVRSRVKANKGKVLIYNPSFLKYVYDSWLEGHGRYPSTGFLSLMFAVHICDEVNVFGFGADHDGNWHHYWEDNMLGGAFRHTGVHDGDYEYNITLLLADKHKIMLYRGG